jgi:signal transduction histidine kinase
MKKLFSSFYGRLSVLFLVLLLFVGAVYIVIAVKSSIGFVQQADQKLNVHLAESIASEIKPLVRDSIHTSGMNHLLHYLMVINPHIEIYILDSTGNILAFFADQNKKLARERVSLKPIQTFLANESEGTVEGDDPRGTARQKPFSAATIKLKGNSLGYVYVILGGEQYDQSSAAIQKQFLSSIIFRGLIVALVSTGLMGLILFFFMTRRLRRVTEVVTGFKEGNLDERLKDNSKDDFGRLALAFNQMADTIVRNMADLKRSDDLRRELVANISHDLRTPLVLVQGYLETIMMKGESLSPEEINRYLEISLKNTKYLSNLVSELFELSKLNAIHVQPSKEPFSILELIQDVIMKYKSSAESKSVVIECKYDVKIPPVTADIGLIERALSNLLDNAIRYADKSTQVIIELAMIDNYVRVKVSDSGPGINAEDIPSIFLPYYRGRKTASPESPGTGLGLAITKRILELHNSEIHVLSEFGRGTTFYFDLARA